MKINPYREIIHNYDGIIYPFDSEVASLTELAGNRELHIELGSGSGNFITAQAKNNRDKLFVGFELRYKRLVLMAKKIQKFGLDNVIGIQHDVRSLNKRVSPEQVDAFYCNFPDPWPKKKHIKNRFLQVNTLKFMTGFLKPEGCFYFKTDDLNLFKWVFENICEVGEFKVIEKNEDYHNSEYFNPDCISEFEQLFMNQGLPIYFLIAQNSVPGNS